MSLVQTLAKMLRHKYTVVHYPSDVEGRSVYLSYTRDERPIRYYVLDEESGAQVRNYSNPKHAAADFIRTVGTRNATLAVREVLSELDAGTQRSVFRNRSMKS